ncbi:phage regulatory CII family protein [Comamonas kerstersii]|uniref:phage regulatory CII family protein n=1 Tax=Comamonas kerstersii TaxID=225992 RepID=UPI001B342188|nr:phage regulatory CII family protein [Comamonas kerstersii]QTW18197.1 phage regulatory CII family protein [Comamonas kerstersii]
MSLMGTISLNLSGIAGNVESSAAINITPGMDVRDAAYLIAHHYPGGVAALAARMGVNPGVLQNKLNPNNDTHHLRLDESVLLQQVAGNAAVLHAMAQQLGFTCVRATPAQDGGDPVEAFMALAMAHADFTRAVADALHGKETVSKNELRRATDMANDLIATVGALVSVLAQRVPQPTSED